MAVIQMDQVLNSPQSDVTSQPPTETSTAKMVEGLLERSKAASKEIRAQWPTNYQFALGGRQWPIERPEWRFSEVINTTWADLMTEVGIQTDARPKVDYIGTEPSDIAFAEVLKEINDVNWQKYPWLQRVAELLLDCKWCHVAHVLDYWDPELENGLGDLAKKILNPYGCYWDPLATDIDDSRYFIYAEPVPTQRLQDEYPQLKDQIKPDVSKVGDENIRIRTSVNVDRAWFNLSSGSRGRRPNPGNERFGGEAMTLKICCWMKDESVEELEQDVIDATTQKPVMDANGIVQKEFVLKKKYPFGRYIEVANHLVLYDGVNGVKVGNEWVPYKHGKFPIVRLVNYSYPREYAGENEITHKLGPQIVKNYVWSFILDSMKQASNPKEIFSLQNREAADKSSNEPGQVLVLNDYNGYRREPGQGVPPNLLNVLEAASKNEQDVGGLQDVIKGAVDPGVTSGILFDGYVEAAQVRPRFKNRNLDQALQRMGQIDAALYLQFYTVQRTFRITNKQGWPEFVNFFVSEDEQGNQIANVSRVKPDETGQNYAPGPTQQMNVKGIPDVEIVSGSSIPFQKAQQYNRAKDLFAMGAIDRQALLEEIDFPKKDEILQRMAQEAQSQAQAKGK